MREGGWITAAGSDSGKYLIQARIRSKALGSPDVALLASWCMPASILLMWRILPLMLTLIFSQRTLARIVAKFLEPGGLPFGFPDCPLTNCLCFGGLPYPTWQGSLRLTLSHPHFCCDIVEAFAGLRRDRLCSGFLCPGAVSDHPVTRS